MSARTPWQRILVAALLAALTLPAVAGQRLPAKDLKPAPVFDAGDGVPGRDKWALGESPAATYRSMPEILPAAAAARRAGCATYVAVPSIWRFNCART